MRDLSHPYDRGYWARYDGQAPPSDAHERRGYDDCQAELLDEATERWDAIIPGGPALPTPGAGQ